MARNSRYKDLTGQQFGSWVVLGWRGMRSKNSVWLCRCDCGHEQEVLTPQLKRGGRCKRCFFDWYRQHGLTGTPTYWAWQHMIKRCYNLKDNHYKYYGARGITVDPRWVKFSEFLSDMGVKPEGLTLGRIDNDKGYGPGNCQWETVYEQANNKSTSHFIEWQGKRQTIAQWATEIGMSRAMLKDRIRYGWSVERALTEPHRGWSKTRKKAA